MADENFFDVFDQAQSFLPALVKTNQLAVATFEKLITLQMNALRFYMDLSLDRMKAAAEVRDVESLQSFISGQVAAAAALSQRWMDDANALAELSTGFGADAARLAKEKATA